jgi:hypothetical protein
LFTLCGASVNALQIAFNNGSYESAEKWENFQIVKEDLVGARLARASVT